MTSQSKFSDSWDASLATREERREQVVHVGDSSFQSLLNRGNVFGNCNHSLIHVKCGCQRELMASLCSLCLTIFCTPECVEETKAAHGQNVGSGSGRDSASNGDFFTGDPLKERARESRLRDREERKTRRRHRRAKKQESIPGDIRSREVKEAAIAEADGESQGEDERLTRALIYGESRALVTTPESSIEDEQESATPVEQSHELPSLNAEQQGSHYQSLPVVAENSGALKQSFYEDTEVEFCFPRIQSKYMIPEIHQTNPMAWNVNLNLPTDCYFKVEITHVVDLENFYVVLECHLQQLQLMEEHISRLASFGLELPNIRNVALPRVACIQVDDHKWRRCSVLSVEEDMCKILLIDRGEEKEAKVRELRVLPTDFYYKNPFAFHCSLSVKPKRGSKWNAKLNDFLRNMAETECSGRAIDGEYPTTKCLKILDSGKHIVEIGILGGEDWAAQLVQAGLAVFSDNAGQ